MTAEFARMRIAKIRNESRYSSHNQSKSNLNNKDINYDAFDPTVWFSIK